IIVNDGSIDNFEEIMPKLTQIGQINGVEVKVLNQANLGAPKARNEGFLVSSGEYLLFWDADTIGNPKMLEKMVKILDQKPEIDFVYSGFKFGWKIFKSFNFDLEKLKKMNYIDITSMIRRSVFKPFDESLKKFQDWDFWLGLALQNKKGERINEILYTKIVRGRKGISSWLPSFFYKLPWKTKEVKKYEEAKEIVLKKYHLK
ncbi:MAG: glycosyltransferase family 2 protein, partial [Candidatus Magasanikbacteria bacterium]|nr:glycosyltransferase family 2 protein [Candidatus Magasanikbacteria bacterium]